MGREARCGARRFILCLDSDGRETRIEFPTRRQAVLPTLMLLRAVFNEAWLMKERYGERFHIAEVGYR